MRSRAFDIAARLYVRLTTWGVALRSSDVAVLLSNLPYDQSATDAKSHEQWFQPMSEKKKVRQSPSVETSKDTSLSDNLPSAFSTTTNVSSKESAWVARWRAYEVAMGNLPLAELAPESISEAAELTHHDHTLETLILSSAEGTMENNLRVVLDHLATIAEDEGDAAIATESLHLVEYYLHHNRPTTLSDAVVAYVVDSHARTLANTGRQPPIYGSKCIVREKRTLSKLARCNRQPATTTNEEMARNDASHSSSHYQSW